MPGAGSAAIQGGLALATGGASAIPSLALGAAQTAISLINAGKAKKEAKELAKSRPQREISPLYGKTLSLAESELAGGMSRGAENAYNNQLDKSTSASLAAILKGGGDINSVGDVFAGGEEGRQRLALINDQLRLSQIDNVVKARNMMSEETDKNFIFNDWMPWADKSQANSQARQDANAGVWSGLQTVAGGISGMIGGGQGGGQSDVPGVTGNQMNYAGRPASSLPNTAGFNPIQQPQIPYRPMTGNSVQRMPQPQFPSYNQLYYGG